MKSLSHNELRQVLQKIEGVLAEAGFPKDSVEIKFKSTSKLEVDSVIGEVNALAGPITDDFECHGCGPGGKGMLCCSF